MPKWKSTRELRGKRLLGPPIARPGAAWIISFGGFVLAAILSVWQQTIVSASQVLVIGPNRGGPHFGVTTFWAALFGWTYVLYRRLKSDHHTEEDRFDRLTSTIHRAPDPSVFLDYPDYYDAAANAIATTYAPHETDAERIRRLTGGIQLVLEIAGTLAAVFSRAQPAKRYGANVMIATKPPFTPELVKALVFFDHERESPDLLRAILYLPKPLILADFEGSNREIPNIALPVPPRDRDDFDHPTALPGAPVAFLTGKQSVQEDARQMVEYCRGFTAGTQTQISRYFSDSGGGKDIGSFVSFRIGDPDNPVGVLNIDCSHTFLLGDEKEYYRSFYALMSPIVRLLAKPTIEFAGLTTARGQLFM